MTKICVYILERKATSPASCLFSILLIAVYSSWCVVLCFLTLYLAKPVDEDSSKQLSSLCECCHGDVASVHVCQLNKGLWLCGLITPRCVVWGRVGCGGVPPTRPSYVVEAGGLMSGQ